MTLADRAARFIMQRENFILRAPSSITQDVACEDVEFPAGCADVCNIIAERLEMQARNYRTQAEEWRRLQP
jgi:hypothetical protein